MSYHEELTEAQKAFISKRHSRGTLKRYARKRRKRAKYIEEGVKRVNDYSGTLSMSQYKELQDKEDKTKSCLSLPSSLCKELIKLIESQDDQK